MIKRLKKLKRNELKIRGNRVNELKIEELERNKLNITESTIYEID